MLARDARDHRAIADPGTAVADPAQSPPFVDPEARGIVDRLAGVEHPDFLHAVDECAAAEFRRVEVLVPEREVVEVAVHLAVADLLPARLVEAKAAARLRVAARERRDRRRIAVHDARVPHAERLEDPLPRKLR